MLIAHQQKLKIEKKVIEKKQFETDLCAAQQKTEQTFPRPLSEFVLKRCVKLGKSLHLLTTRFKIQLEALVSATLYTFLAFLSRTISSKI